MEFFFVLIMGALVIGALFVMVKNIGPHTRLFNAVIEGNAVVVEEILNSNPDFINKFDERYRTPLHLAALYGHFDIVKILVSRGAEIIVRDANAETVLHQAAYSEASEAELIEICDYLIKKGLPVNTMDYEGNTPLHIASYYGKLYLADMLVKYGADVKIKNINNETAYDMAVQNQDEQMASILMRKM